MTSELGETITEAPAAQAIDGKPLRIWFDHGLGDCVHIAHVLQLYKRRGWNPAVHHEENKTAVFHAAELPWVDIDGLPYTHWVYPDDFNNPSPAGDAIGSKTAGNLHLEPLPPLGDRQMVWDELCNTISLEGSISKVLRPEHREEVDRFVQHLPEPIVLMHTHGTNFAPHKNVPEKTAQWLYRRLLAGMPGSLILLDWDQRVPRLPHGRVRHLLDDWGHIDLYQLGALFERAALLIGIDSGPYHFAALTNTPALGIFHDFYPSCVTLPRARNLNLTRAALREVNIACRRRWNVVEYAGRYPTAAEISRHALRMLQRPRYLLQPHQIAQDVQMQQWIRDWCHGSTGSSPLADRNVTFDLLLREIPRRFDAPTIIETGCIRHREDWAGAGYSTYLFAAFLSRLGAGRLISVDITAEYAGFAAAETAVWGADVQVVVADSVQWLSACQERIDVLYLDSADVGVPGFAEHALREVQAAEPKLGERSIIMFDDTVWNRGWNGKGELAVPYLLSRGWKLRGSGYQVILTRDQ